MLLVVHDFYEAHRPQNQASQRVWNRPESEGPESVRFQEDDIVSGISWLLSISGKIMQRLKKTVVSSLQSVCFIRVDG